MCFAPVSVSPVSPRHGLCAKTTRGASDFWEFSEYPGCLIGQTVAASESAGVDSCYCGRQVMGCSQRLSGLGYFKKPSGHKARTDRLAGRVPGYGTGKDYQVPGTRTVYRSKGRVRRFKVQTRQVSTGTGTRNP